MTRLTGRIDPSGTDALGCASPGSVYERLLRDVPEGARVSDCVVGLVWSMVSTDDGRAGVALTCIDGVHESRIGGAIRGRDLREVAHWLSSWNLFEAAVGCAALNAVFNTRAAVEHLVGHRVAEASWNGKRVFERLAERFAGGKVALVGHFHGTEALAQRCELTVLERRPAGDDLPDSACEWVLPRQDCVCITGTALINKTLPHLLELSRSAHVLLVGPSVPLSPLWFDVGVDVLAGSIVSNPSALRPIVAEGGHRRAFQGCLPMVEIKAEDVCDRRCVDSRRRSLAADSRSRRAAVAPDRVPALSPRADRRSRPEAVAETVDCG
jgi:uncharacterized protein